MNQPIFIGQEVKLINISKVYMTYKSAFINMNFTNQVQNPQTTDLRQFENTTFTVFSIGFGKYQELFGIENENGVQILIKRSGVTVVKKTINFNTSNTL